MAEMLLPFWPSAEGLLVRRLLFVVVSALSRGVVLRLVLAVKYVGNANAKRLCNTNAKDKIKGRGARDEAGLCKFLIFLWKEGRSNSNRFGFSFRS